MRTERLSAIRRPTDALERAARLTSVIRMIWTRLSVRAAALSKKCCAMVPLLLEPLVRAERIMCGCVLNGPKVVLKHPFE